HAEEFRAGTRDHDVRATPGRCGDYLLVRVLRERRQRRVLATCRGMCDTAQTGPLGPVNFPHERTRLLPSDCSTDSALVCWRRYPRWRPYFVTKRRLKK